MPVSDNFADAVQCAREVSINARDKFTPFRDNSHWGGDYEVLQTVNRLMGRIDKMRSQMRIAYIKAVSGPGGTRLAQ